MTPFQSTAKSGDRMRAGQRFLVAYDRLLQFFGVISALGLLAIPILVSTDVISRYAFGWSFIWLNDVCEYILYVSTMIGAPWLLQLGRHVRIDILPGLLPAQASRRLEQSISILLFGVCLTIIVYAVGSLQLSLKYQAMLYKAVTLPVWPFTAIFIASFSVICLELIVRLFTGRNTTENEPVSY